MHEEDELMVDSKQISGSSIRESDEDRASEGNIKILVTDEVEEHLKVENPTNKHQSM